MRLANRQMPATRSNEFDRCLESIHLKVVVSHKLIKRFEIQNHPMSVVLFRTDKHIGDVAIWGIMSSFYDPFAKEFSNFIVNNLSV